jgi:hypothetical protein
MTVNTRVVQLFLRQEDRAYVPLENGLRLQILPDVSFLPQCQKHHFAAFIQDSAVLVVWDDQPTHILSRVKDIEDQLMSMIWNDSAYDDGRLVQGPSGKLARQNMDHIPEVDVEAGEHNEKMLEEPRKTVLVHTCSHNADLGHCRNWNRCPPDDDRGQSRPQLPPTSTACRGSSSNMACPGKPIPITTSQACY